MADKSSDPYWAAARVAAHRGTADYEAADRNEPTRIDFDAGVETFAREMDEYRKDHPDALPATEGATRSYLDVDGYLSFAPHEIPEHIIQEARVDDFELTTLHYMLRSVLVLGLDVGPGDRAGFQKFSENCATQAFHMLATRQQLPTPAWIPDFTNKLKRTKIADPDAIDAISISTVLRPQIYAYSFPDSNRIEVSAVAREHLRTVDLLIWSVANGLLDPTTRASALEHGRSLIDILLFYVFALYFPRTNYSSLPTVRAPSLEIFSRACSTAQIQVQFLLAHEYAHLLKHMGQRPHRELEYEADQFAYDLLFDSPEFSVKNQYQVFLAARWLFLYLSLDRVVGAVLSDYDIDWIDLPIRARDALLIPRFSTLVAAKEMQMSGLMGELLLVQAKRELMTRGPAWIKRAAREFEKRHCHQGGK